MVASIPNDIFQFSTSAALTAGFDTGGPSTVDLKSHGTCGIGTYEDGSLMILLFEHAFALRQDHTAVPAPSDSKLLFTMVTVFQPRYRLTMHSLSLDSLEDCLSSSEIGPGKSINSMTSFQITTSFSQLSLEGVELTNVRGTIFGFVVPRWMRSISGPRIHAHFITEGEDTGGRIEGFEADGEALLMFAKCGRFHLGFPQEPAWEDIRLSNN